MTPRRGRILIGLLVSVVLAALASGPVRAQQTEDRLRAARARLQVVQAELNRLAAEYSRAQSDLAETEAKMAEVRAEVEALQARMRLLRQQVAERIRAAYVSGGASTMEVLLTSRSVADFSDRMEFLGRLAREDRDLLTQARVTGERLRRREDDLGRLSAHQHATLADLGARKQAIAGLLAEARALEAQLERQLAAERAAAAAAARAAAERARHGPVVPGGALRACPTGTPRAFTNDFGAPRPGGRTHQGIDILAPLGTPVYAAQSGRFTENFNTLGGIGALVHADNGDYTYYAHLSRLAGVPNGAHVAAGSLIGYVGNTGNAAGGPYHLHFEWHPGGGAAANPYYELLRVC